MASVVMGFEKTYTQKVSEPFGVLVGGYHADAAASMAIESVHRYPMLLESATFAELYQKFLKLIAQWNNKTKGVYSDPRFVRELDRELDGTYVLETPTAGLPSEYPAPAPVEVPTPAPSAQILPVVQRAAQPIDSMIPREAQRYLDGTI
jgi:hypothetical protein